MNKSGATSSAKAAQQTPAPIGPSTEQTPSTAVGGEVLVECKYCSRRFTSERLTTHEKICETIKKKQRKVYDATKHRVQGTVIEPYVDTKPSNFGKSPSKAQQASPRLKNNWRSTHQEFIAIIRSAKMTESHLAKGGKLSDLPPPPPSSNPDYIQCPHCGRRFNVSAAERHIPKCATFEHNKPKPTASTKTKPKKPAGRKF